MLLFLAQEAVANGYEMVVAVGGDGSVNEVASQLVDTSVVLGIIPLGSGNGFTKLGIPLKQIAAIKSATNTGHPMAIDVGMLTPTLFF